MFNWINKPLKAGRPLGWQGRRCAVRITCTDTFYDTLKKKSLDSCERKLLLPSVFYVDITCQYHLFSVLLLASKGDMARIRQQPRANERVVLAVRNKHFGFKCKKPTTRYIYITTVSKAKKNLWQVNLTFPELV